MKTLLSVLIMLWFSPQPSCLVKGKGFRGYLFDKDHFVLMSIENQQARYTPEEQDVLLAERIIKDGLAVVNSPMDNQGGGCPVIHKNLKKYIRQYVGFVNEAGEKVIWINFIWKSNADEKRLANDIESALDGCSHYWNIKVNIGKSTLYELNINGSA